MKKITSEHRAAEAKRCREHWRVDANDKGGHSLELKSEGATELNEVCAGHWFSLERLDRGGWFMELGDRAFWIKVGRDGKAKITSEETRP